MKRIPIRNKVTGNMIESSIISLHFSSIQHKQHFYSLYLCKMPLKPENIGLSKELKIIIGESLTRSNAQIFKFAQNMKKENKIAQVFTADGLVKIKNVEGPKQHAHIIRHTMQLEILLKEHEQQKNQQNQTPTNEMEVDVVNAGRQQSGSNVLNASIELLSNERNTTSAPGTNGKQQQQQTIQGNVHSHNPS